MTRVLGPDHRDTLVARSCYAWLKVQTGDVAAAEPIFRDLVPRANRLFGEQSPAGVSFQMRLGHILLLQEKWAEAEPYLKSAYDGAQVIGIGKAQGGYSSAYGTCLVKLGRANEGLPLLLAADEMITRGPPSPPLVKQRLYDAIIEAYVQLGQPESAAPWQAKRDALAPNSQPTR